MIRPSRDARGGAFFVNRRIRRDAGRGGGTTQGMEAIRATSPRAVPIEDLLAHASWVRRLARRLVADADGAADVEQDTWLAALRRPPAEATNLRSWLAAAVRSAARGRGRAEGRRRRREREAARSRPESTGEGAAERAALQRDLVDRVLRLPDPYRAAVLARYFEDERPARTAARLGLPASTVRTRLARGLALLREELDRDWDDRRGWCLALAALAPRAPLPGLLHPATLVPWAAALGAAALLLVGGGPWGASAPGAPDPRALLPAGEPGARREAVPPAGGGELAERTGPPAPPEPAEAPRSPVPAPSPAPRGLLATAPPGLVRVPGGPTWIGTPLPDVLPLIRDTGIKKLVAETPRHQALVADFDLMVTEVTAEQYAEFVHATGARPPRSWGQEAIAEAALAFAHAEAERRRELLEQGVAVIAHRRFDSAAWWNENWPEAEWAVPEDRRSTPVEYVDYQEAAAYARWAGLRLMTEHEFQRAGRGNGESVFPWGDGFDGARAATLESGSPNSYPVGSFALGATPYGVHDLVGNVWEWTSSPFLAYPGYEAVELDPGEDYAVDWNPGQRVVVGGCYKTPWVAGRLSTRRATVRDQATDAVGFRCAASPRPGVDLAAAVVERGPAPPEGVRYRPDRAVGLDRWRSVPGTAAVADYRVITGYEHVVFVPVEKLPLGPGVSLAELSRARGPVHLGLLVTSARVSGPELEPGTYRVTVAAGPDGPARLRFSAPGRPEGEVDGPEPKLAPAVLDAPRGRVVPLGPAGDPYRELELAAPLDAGEGPVELRLRLRFAAGALGADWRRP